MRSQIESDLPSNLYGRIWDFYFLLLVQLRKCTGSTIDLYGALSPLTSILSAIPDNFGRDRVALRSPAEGIVLSVSHLCFLREMKFYEAMSKLDRTEEEMVQYRVCG
jgi:hypothetical protein